MSMAGAWSRHLIEPRGSVVGPEHRRRSRYTALYVSILIPLGLIAIALTLANQGIAASATALGIMGAAVGLLLLLYPISLGRSYQAASYLAILVTCAAIWGEWYLALGFEPMNATLYFLALPIFMASLLAGARGAVITAGVNLAVAILLVPALAHPETLDSKLTLPFFLFITSGLVVNAAWVRERDLDEVERLASELRKHENARLQMLSNIAHDLASPLTPLKLQVGLLAQQQAVAPERLGVLKRNLGQIERLVADVKDLARLEARAMRCEMEDVDIAACAEAAVAAFRPDAEARGVALQLHVETPARTRADAQRMTQVLYNLVTNALKFTPRGGKVLVRVGRAEAEILVEVTDDGRGLAPDEIARLFRPFSQAHERGEIPERGTGLGLYISRGIAEAHGGRLSVRSAGRGHGSTFTLALPETKP